MKSRKDYELETDKTPYEDDSKGSFHDEYVTWLEIKIEELEKENKELKEAIIKHVMDSLKMDLFPIGNELDYETIKQKLFNKT